MRLSPSQQQSIRETAEQVFGPAVRVRVVGSRIDDSVKGGDLDLMVELPSAVEHPAGLAATLSAKVSRTMNGRNVDVIVSAPGLRRLQIHDIAFRDGVLL
ncbi:MAG: nucleotidyltransferase domain-containing protein [Thiohalocapsa sp.]|nr:nucleotidyltransferase domain-containing protein [Thiohalocapsa sp.]